MYTKKTMLESSNMVLFIMRHVHRRTRRGVGEDSRHPGFEKFQGNSVFSEQAQVAQKSWMIKIHIQYS